MPHLHFHQTTKIGDIIEYVVNFIRMFLLLKYQTYLKLQEPKTFNIDLTKHFLQGDP